MKIQVRIKNFWNKDRFYPACQVSQVICDWLDQKSLTQKDIEFVKRLGYTVEVVPEVRSL